MIYGCINGYSRRIVFLQCSDNNLSQIVLNLFLNAVNSDGGIWPSKILPDYDKTYLSVIQWLKNVERGQIVSLQVHEQEAYISKECGER